MSSREYDRCEAEQFALRAAGIALPVTQDDPAGTLAVGGLFEVFVVAQPQIERTASNAAQVRVVMGTAPARFDNNAMVRAPLRDTNVRNPPQLMRCEPRTRGAGHDPQNPTA